MFNGFLTLQCSYPRSNRRSRTAFLVADRPLHACNSAGSRCLGGCIASKGHGHRRRLGTAGSSLNCRGYDHCQSAVGRIPRVSHFARLCHALMPYCRFLLVFFVRRPAIYKSLIVMGGYSGGTGGCHCNRPGAWAGAWQFRSLGLVPFRYWASITIDSWRVAAGMSWIEISFFLRPFLPL